jgi:hypothetical protein
MNSVQRVENLTNRVAMGSVIWKFHYRKKYKSYRNFASHQICSEIIRLKKILKSFSPRINTIHQLKQFF